MTKNAIKRRIILRRLNTPLLNTKNANPAHLLPPHPATALNLSPDSGDSLKLKLNNVYPAGIRRHFFSRGS